MDLLLCPLFPPTKSETNVHLRFCILLSVNKKLNIKVLTYLYLYLLSLSIIDSFSRLIFFSPFLLYFYVFHLNYLIYEWFFTRISRSLRAFFLSNTFIYMHIRHSGSNQFPISNGISKYSFFFILLFLFLASSYFRKISNYDVLQSFLRKRLRNFSWYL